MTGKQKFWGGLAVGGGAVVLALVLFFWGAWPLFAFDPRGQEETIRLVNQQLQDVLAPQLKGKQIVSFLEAEPGWGKYIGTTNFLDRRFYYSQEHMSRIRGVNGVCETFIANG